VVPVTKSVTPDPLPVGACAVAAFQVLQKPSAPRTEDAGVPPGEGGIKDCKDVADLTAESELKTGQVHRLPEDGGIGGVEDYEARHKVSRSRYIGE
jgi:hypothetical protein